MGNFWLSGRGTNEEDNKDFFVRDWYEERILYWLRLRSKSFVFATSFGSPFFFFLKGKKIFLKGGSISLLRWFSFLGEFFSLEIWIWGGAVYLFFFKSKLSSVIMS